MNEPTTAAARFIMDRVTEAPGQVLDLSAAALRPWLAEVEAAARTQERNRILEAIAALEGYRDPRYSGEYVIHGLLSRSSVLRAIGDQS